MFLFCLFVSSCRVAHFWSLLLVRPGGQFRVPHDLLPVFVLFDKFVISELVDKLFCWSVLPATKQALKQTNNKTRDFKEKSFVTKKHQQRTHNSNCPDLEALPVEFNYDPQPLPHGKFPVPRPCSWGSCSVLIVDLLCNWLAAEASVPSQRIVQLLLTASWQMDSISSKFLLNAAMFCIKFAIVIQKRDLAQLFHCHFQFLINPLKPIANMTPSIVVCGFFLRPFILCEMHCGAHKYGSNLHMATSLVYTLLHIIVARDSMRPTSPLGSVMRKMLFSPIIKTTIFGPSLRICLKSSFPPSSEKHNLSHFPSQFEWVFHPGVGTGN